MSTEAVWQSVSTVEDLQRAMGSYLRGELGESLWYAGPLDEESEEILPFLLRLNGLGLIPNSSQPGIGEEQQIYSHEADPLSPDPSELIRQIAFLEAFIRDEFAVETQLKLQEKGHRCIVRRAGYDAPSDPMARFGVTAVGMEWYTLVSTDFPNAETLEIAEIYSPSVRALFRKELAILEITAQNFGETALWTDLIEILEGSNGKTPEHRQADSS